MLEDIYELSLAVTSNDTAEQSTDEAVQAESDGICALFGSTSVLSLHDVLTRYLPLRQEVDRLTAAYFRAQAIAVPFIHTAQFQKLYKRFWADPLSAPPLWTSILFSVCHIATNTLKSNTDATATDFRFSTASAHCLAIGEYFRPKQFSVQSLLLYAQSLRLTSIDLSPGLGVLFGALIRTATSMGYHRDLPAAGLSPFETEMRRRAWSLCVQLDLLVSFHLGIPSSLPYSWDAKPPLNLHDSDFDENSAELPAERRESELTSTLFYNTKYKFMAIFDKIMRHTLMTRAGSPGSTESDALDAEIRQVYASLPDILRPRPLSESVVDPPSIIVTRLCVSALYYKCLCVLHRPYVVQHRPESVIACHTASCGLVRDFADVFHEFGPNGQAVTERWFLSSLTWHDFLLGAMALCLVTVVTSQTAAEHLVDTQEAMDLLKRARDISGEQTNVRGNGTRKVHLLINATIQRLENEGVGSVPTKSAFSARRGDEHDEQAHFSPHEWDRDLGLQGAVVDSLWDEHLQDLLELPSDSFLDAL